MKHVFFISLRLKYSASCIGEGVDKPARGLSVTHICSSFGYTFQFQLNVDYISLGDVYRTTANIEYPTLHTTHYTLHTTHYTLHTTHYTLLTKLPTQHTTGTGGESVDVTAIPAVLASDGRQLGQGGLE